MCFMGGGGGAQPQVIYRDNPSTSVAPTPTPPTPMASGVMPADTMADVEQASRTQGMGTSVFKINKDAQMTNDYEDQGIDSGISYQ
jgi:hypothetical protein